MSVATYACTYFEISTSVGFLRTYVHVLEYLVEDLDDILCTYDSRLGQFSFGCLDNNEDNITVVGHYPCDSICCFPNQVLNQVPNHPKNISNQCTHQGTHSHTGSIATSATAKATATVGEKNGEFLRNVGNARVYPAGVRESGQFQR